MNAFYQVLNDDSVCAFNIEVAYDDELGDWIVAETESTRPTPRWMETLYNNTRFDDIAY
jgi:hypothetical protein